MLAIMISIKPQHACNIMNLLKTIEVRKNEPLAKAIKKLIAMYGKAKIYVYVSKCKPYLIDFIVDGYILSNVIGNDIYNGKVAFMFECEKVEEITPKLWTPTKEREILNNACLTENELFGYIGDNNNKSFYAINISNLKIFDKPKEIREFKIRCPKTKNKYCECNCKHESDCPYKYGYNGGDYETYNFCCQLLDLYNDAIMPLTKAPQNFCYLEVEE